MKLIKCGNTPSHYYDADKYADCPHCAKLTGPARQQSPEPPPPNFQPSARSAPPERPETESRTSSLWAEPPAPPPAPAPAPSGPACPACGAPLREDAVFCVECGKRVTPEPPAALACPACGTPLPGDSVFCVRCGKRLDPAFAEAPAPAPVIPSTAAPSPAPAPAAPSLQSAVDAVRTGGVDTQDMKTVAFYNTAHGTEPVVGWLVCTQGSYFGEGFPLKAGRNSIGRQMDNDVPLAQETTVSRRAHAILTFDPKQQAFFIQPGEGSGLTYRNDELVSGFTPLRPYDTLQLGSAAFVFAPFCGEHFRWEDHI
ncbi:MAG: zinc ribbon domain-containing protein [Oscillospiraceae bacterium]|jgi:predicted nucleic acid-binding Zn ribbon protein|nr:zinc ribbon domain-containing protein [Oscillospiraceae bacterium]